MNKIDTSIQRSPTTEENTASSQIKEKILKSVFSKIVKESNSSERVNLANYAIIEPLKLRYFGHTPMETDNVGGIVATRIEHSGGIWRRTARDNRMAHTYDDIVTISEKITYRKHIRDLEFETREVLDRETSNKNIENIGTRLYKTRLDNNQMTRSADSSKHSERTNQK